MRVYAWAYLEVRIELGGRKRGWRREGTEVTTSTAMF